MKKVKLIDFVKEKYNLTEKEAVGYILSGNVLVDEKIITKVGVFINTSLNVRIRSKSKYVSRGAYKLLHAVNKFNIDIKDKVCVDCGSSTGGFTQVMLEKGAKKVYAVDCGNNLLHYSLRNDSRVFVMENHKVNELKIADFADEIDLAVMDISFSSSVQLVEYLFEKLNVNDVLVLIKPQFEYNRLKERLQLPDDFNGVIKDENIRKQIIDCIICEINDKGFNILGITPSSIKGTKGNLEYFLNIRK